MTTKETTHLEELKNVIIDILKDKPEGILKHTIWGLVKEKVEYDIHTRYNLTRKTFKNVFETDSWKDYFEEVNSKDGPLLRLRTRAIKKAQASSNDQVFTPLQSDFPPLTGPPNTAASHPAPQLPSPLIFESPLLIPQRMPPTLRHTRNTLNVNQPPPRYGPLQRLTPGSDGNTNTMRTPQIPVRYTYTGESVSDNVIKSEGGLPFSGQGQQPMLAPQDVQKHSESIYSRTQSQSDVLNILSTTSVEKKEFSAKNIVAERVCLPKGQIPNKQIVENITKECIELMANANEFVTEDRVEKLLCQRFSVSKVQQLGLSNIQELTCIRELQRLVWKINAYIQAFVKTRSMCTLHELHDCLREYVPDRQDFSKLNLGPLQRFTEIYRLFKFPPDQEDIPEITSIDLLEHLLRYMTKNNKWTSRLELPDFLDYLVKEYNADDAYYLGIQIKSLPLALTVLKKAQLHENQNRREIFQHFKNVLETEIENAFQKFRTSILQSGDDGMEIRRHYLKLKPEDVLMEILSKYQLLVMITKPSTLREQRDIQRFSHVIEAFVETMKTKKVVKQLFHLAVCISSTQLQECAMEILMSPSPSQTSSVVHTPSQPEKPTKAVLLGTFETLIEKCLKSGSQLNLLHLGRIEERLLDEFNFLTFHDMGYGHFLRFIVKEAKQTLEGCGGVLLGPGMAGSSPGVTFQVQRADILEFINQCYQCGLTMPNQIEQAIRSQYGIKDFHHLGHGSFEHIVKIASKSSKDVPVIYEEALVARSGVHAVNLAQVGVLGHQSKYNAKVCLHNCPLLQPLDEWSHWGLVFEPQFGKLKDFIQKNGGVTTHVEGASLVTFDIVAMETKPGHLIKITGNTSPDQFATALEERDVTSVCGHLVSLTVSNKGIENMPAALLSGYVKTALLNMQAMESSTDTHGAPQPLDKPNNQAVQFALKCLVLLPTRICVATASQILLEPLAYVIGSAKSKQSLFESCSSVMERNRLLELGCLLGISEWTESLQARCVWSDTAGMDKISLEVADEDEEEESVGLYGSGSELEVYSDYETEAEERQDNNTTVTSVVDDRLGPVSDSKDVDMIDNAASQDVDMNKSAAIEDKHRNESAAIEDMNRNDNAASDDIDRNENATIEDMNINDNATSEDIDRNENATIEDMNRNNNAASEDIDRNENAAMEDIVRDMLRDMVTAIQEKEMNDNGTVCSENKDRNDYDASGDMDMKDNASSEDMGSGDVDIDMNTEDNLTWCQKLINDIRHDEFGIGVQLNEAAERLMKVHEERHGRTLDRLSKDLYNNDTHFVLELIQNADDNDYTEEQLSSQSRKCPAVTFCVDKTGITVLNNEQGFQEKHIRAVCDVGKSTKGKHKYGYIGQKGIGFKSVFRVTDCPEVHSNGFHIKFDVKSGPMGYIMPHWLDEVDDTDQIVQGQIWMTKIYLPLKSDISDSDIKNLPVRFDDIHPSLLLFLHRIREISVDNQITGSVQKMRRFDVANNVVKIKHTGGTDRWLVIKKTLDASQISLKAKAGVDVSSTEIALAFPLRSRGSQGQASVTQALPPKQRVFAFLPLRSYGFRFIVQGDFDVPSSREDVDRDSVWNQWLRNKIHTHFIDSLDMFKSLPTLNEIEAVSVFLQFVPMQDEVLDFFKPVANQILQKLKARPCIPTQPNAQGFVEWKIPSHTVQVRDPLVREVITAELLQKHLNLYYLHSDVAAILNPTLTSCLGIENLKSEHMFQLGKAMIVSMATHLDQDNVITISRWLACMYRSLDDFNDDVLDKLKSLCMLPLSNGELVALSEKTVFLPIGDGRHTDKAGQDPFYYLRQDICSLHPLLLNTSDKEVNSQVEKLLRKLDIKQLSPSDVINHHILPVLKSDDWQQKPRETLVAYIIYIKENREKQPLVCDISELKAVAQLVTNRGLKNPSREPVHFTPLYANKIDLAKTFDCYDWILLDACYMPANRTQAAAHSWHEFLAMLGVEDFLSIREETKHLNQDTIGMSPWASQQKDLPDMPEYIIKDFHSPELTALIEENKKATGPEYQRQMRDLCILLDKHWDHRFSKYIETQIKDTDMKPLADVETSMSRLLQTANWLPAVHTHLLAADDGTVKKKQEVLLKPPSHLYIQSEDAVKYLAHTVPYLDVQLKPGMFVDFLGVKTEVAVETVKQCLLQWSERGKPEEPAVFCTSLNHMKHIYSYLSNFMTKPDLQNLLCNESVYFVPNRKYGHKSPVNDSLVVGELLGRNEVWITDETGLFEKYSQLLEDFHSEICQKRIIAKYYQDSQAILYMFKLDGRLEPRPKVEEYVELLSLLCDTSTPKDQEIFSDVLYIFTTIGKAMMQPPEGLPDEQTEKMVMTEMRKTVKRLMEKKKVFPTKCEVWVSLEDCPLIADNYEWEKMFAGKEGVHFLNVEEKQKKRPAVRRKLGWDKGHESRIQRPLVDEFVSVCGIRRLSECVGTDLTPTAAVAQSRMGLLHFHNVVPVIQAWLIARFHDVYKQHGNTKSMLKTATFYQSTHLEVTYRLNLKKGNELQSRHEKKCVIDPPTVYFHQAYLDAKTEINEEIVRFFSRGDIDCYNTLRSFLVEFYNTADADMADLLDRYQMNLDIDPDEQWEVPEPTTPEAEVTPVQTESKVITREFELCSWPTQANESDKPRRKESSEQQNSNIWPPPNAKDYMESVKKLLSSIKIVDAKTEAGNDTGKGDNSCPSDKSTVTEPDLSARTENRKKHMNEGTGDKVEKMKVSDADESVSTEPSGYPAGHKRPHRPTTGDHSSGTEKGRRGKRSGKLPPVPAVGKEVWSYMSTDYTYEELGHGKELGLATDVTLTLEDEEADEEVGYWGEKFVYHYLLGQKQKGNILDVKWMNDKSEMGGSYDIAIRMSDKHVQYIEVKATSSDTKAVFRISLPQILFAEEEGESFSIYRVFNAGNPDTVKLTRISNVCQRLTEKHIKLCMLI